MDRPLPLSTMDAATREATTRKFLLLPLFPSPRRPVVPQLLPFPQLLNLLPGLVQPRSNREVRTEEASMDSPDAPASTGRLGVGRSPPEECRRLRSLLCGPGSARIPGRAPGGGVSCARGPWCVACSTSSPALAAFSCPRGTPFCCISTFSFGPALWWRAAARSVRTVCCSCRNIERSRRSRRRRASPEGCPLSSSIVGHAKNTEDNANLSEPGGGGGVCVWCAVCVVRHA